MPVTVSRVRIPPSPQRQNLIYFHIKILASVGSVVVGFELVRITLWLRSLKNPKSVARSLKVFSLPLRKNKERSDYIFAGCRNSPAAPQLFESTSDYILREC